MTDQIEVKNVTFEYQVEKGRVLAIKDINFSVRQSEFVCLLGPSGCGKTTILNILAGLLQPSAGEIRMGSAPLNGSRQNRGVVFQDFAQLFPWRTARYNVEFGLEMRKVDKTTREKTALDFLRDKQLLLVLDNFEQIVDAAPFLAQLLRVAPRLKLLVTSRTPLRVRIEHEFPLAPFEVPAQQMWHNRTALEQSAAIQAWSALGQEATAVGGCWAIRKDDYMTCTYRGHGQALAKGLSPRAAMAEMLGKATGCSKGKGGSMHFTDREHGVMVGNAIVGAGIPIAAGIALANGLAYTAEAVLLWYLLNRRFASVVVENGGSLVKAARVG